MDTVGDVSAYQDDDRSGQFGALDYRWMYVGKEPTARPDGVSLRLSWRYGKKKMREAKITDKQQAGSAKFSGMIGFSSLRRAVKAGNVIINAALYVDDDGVRATAPIYDPGKDETTVCVLTVRGQGPHVYKTLQAAKNAMHKCGITHYSIVRDGVECWT